MRLSKKNTRILRALLTIFFSLQASWQPFRQLSSTRPDPDKDARLEPDKGPPNAGIPVDKIPVASVSLFCIFLYFYGLDAKIEKLNSASSGDSTQYDFIRRNFTFRISGDNKVEGPWWTWVTNSFYHAGPLHLGLNMAALWAFGIEFVRLFGGTAFWVTWIVSSASCSAATLLQGADWGTRGKTGQEMGKKTRKSDVHLINSGDGDGISYPSSESGHESSISESHLHQQMDELERQGSINTAAPRGGVGSSGAIFGLATAVGCRIPRSTGAAGIPLWVFLGGYAAFSVYCLASDAVVSVGHAGHLGGMASGAMIYYGTLRSWLRRLGR